MRDSVVYLAAAIAALIAVVQTYRVHGLSRARHLDVAHQAQLDQDAMEYVAATADNLAARGIAYPGSTALAQYTKQQGLGTTR